MRSWLMYFYRERLAIDVDMAYPFPADELLEPVDGDVVDGRQICLALHAEEVVALVLRVELRAELLGADFLGLGLHGELNPAFKFYL